MLKIRSIKIGRMPGVGGWIDHDTLVGEVAANSDSFPSLGLTLSQEAICQIEAIAKKDFQKSLEALTEQPNTVNQSEHSLKASSSNKLGGAVKCG